jgi:hypothetical protein
MVLNQTEIIWSMSYQVVQSAHAHKCSGQVLPVAEARAWVGIGPGGLGCAVEDAWAGTGP